MRAPPARAVIDSILARAPHAAAFAELVRRLDLEPTDALGAAEAILPKLADWPSDARQLGGSDPGAIGLAGRRLVRRFAAELPATEDLPELRQLVAAMPELDGLEIVMPLDDDMTPPLLEAAPATLTHVALHAAPARREAGAWAKATLRALARQTKLESVELSAGSAAPLVIEELASRPLTRLVTPAAPLDDPALLTTLDARALRALRLGMVDGIPETWTTAALHAVFVRLGKLTELSTPWIDARTVKALSDLEDLEVIAPPDPRALTDLLGALPKGLRALRVLGATVDAVLPAFTRCPRLERASWIGQELSPAGLDAFLASGALARLTKLELGASIDREVAAQLFEAGAPKKLRSLLVAGMDLGDAAASHLATKRWLAHLDELDLQHNGLSDKALASIVEAAATHAKGLVVLRVHGNQVGRATRDALATLRARGVAIDHPDDAADARVAASSARAADEAAPSQRAKRAAKGTAPTANDKDAPKAAAKPQPATKGRAAPATGRGTAGASIADAWRRIDTWLLANDAEIPGLGRPSSDKGLARATHFPASLRALYAAHDGLDGIAEVLGFGQIVWWPLSLAGKVAPVEIGGRRFAVFAALLDEDDDGDLPIPEDEPEDLLAVDVETEEVVQLQMRKRLTAVVAEDLATSLGGVAELVASGKRVFDENGRLQAPSTVTRQKSVAPPRGAEPAPAKGADAGAAKAAKKPAPRTSPTQEIAAVLVERGLIELRDGATAADLAAAFDTALDAATHGARRRAILEIFEDNPIVDEVFAAEDELDKIADHLAR